MSKRPLRVLQLIDSLRPGGAERMAISYANALSRRIESSHLCCTRMEGLLREDLVPEVGYLFLEKKTSLDFRALLRLRGYIKNHKIELIQAHGTSWFMGLLVKLSIPEVKLVWHDHFGERALQNKKPGILKPASKFFDGVFTVNSALKDWAHQNLHTSRVLYIKNFISESPGEKRPARSSFTDVSKDAVDKLKGGSSLKIICVANLKPPKDHLNLLRAFIELIKKKTDISLHLIGKDEQDFYSQEIKNFLKEQKLEEHVFLYGEQKEVATLIKQADLAVLSSSSEGLPVALLEYGACGMPVVCTDVGQCAAVIGPHGRLVPPKQAFSLARAMKWYLTNPEERKRDATTFYQKIMLEYSEAVVIPQVLNFFENLKENCRS